MKNVYATGSNLVLKEYAFEAEKKTSLIINPKKEEVQFYQIHHAGDSKLKEGEIVMIKGFPITFNIDDIKYNIVEEKQIIAVIDE